MGEESGGWILALLGLFLLLGVFADVAGRRAHVPRVTLLLLLGFLAGSYVFDDSAAIVNTWFPLVAGVALSMVGFILGERFFGRSLREVGRRVLWVSMFESLAAVVVVFVVLWALGVNFTLAILLAGLAPATAPAATLDVIRETKARGPVTDVTTGVVAIDDAYGVILFSLLLVAAQSLAGGESSWSVVLAGVWEILGALLLGLAFGVPMAWISGRLDPGQLTLLEALGFTLLCGGVAAMIQVSHIMACMAMGAMVARRSREGVRPLNAIEDVSRPFLVLFFLLAGFGFEPSAFIAMAGVVFAYVGARSVGKVVGGYLGARASGGSVRFRRTVGWCLFPQAGVALGLALIAVERFPETGRTLLSVIVGTTFIFEVIGPVATRLALGRAGEVGAADGASSSA
jgi:Kef-type K+ transport system membrane component KefB